ncbi:MAG: polysaccharide biosynthesis C-terminal domain-containing protein [Planctomycetota bacterium]
MLKNVGSNWALSALQILVFLVLTPFVLSSLGTGPFGIWETIVSLAGPLQLLILGVPMASVRYISEHLAKGDLPAANRAVSTCAGIALVMGLVALVVGLGLGQVFEQYLASDRWALSAAEISDARLAFGVLVFTLAAGFWLRLPYGIFDAHQDFVARNLIMGGGLLIRLALTLALLSWHVSLSVLAAVQTITLVVEFVTAVVVSRRRHTGIRFGVSGFDRKLLGSILAFSVFSMLLNVGSLLAFRLDALVIGAFQNQEQVTVYGIGNKVFEPFLNLVLAIGMVVMPLATSKMARGGRDELRRVLLQWSKVCVSLVLLVGTFLLVLGPEFLDLWMPADEYDPRSGFLLQILMVSFLIFLPVRGVALPILMGLGKPGRPALALLLMGLLNVGLSIALIGPLGLPGVALGTAIPNVLFAGFVLTTACGELHVRLGEYLRHVLGRALPGVVVPVIFLLLLKWGPGVSSRPALLGSGLGFTVLFAACWILFVYRGDPHLDLYARIASRRSKGR